MDAAVSVTYQTLQVAEGAVLAPLEDVLHAQPGGEGEGKPPVDWAEFNKKNRMGAESFAKCCPLAQIIVLKVCQEPLLNDVLAPLLRIASDKWDLQNVAEAVAGKDFKLRLLELSKDAGLHNFFDSIRKCLFERSKWAALPRSSATTAVATLAFRLSSRVAG
jgi:hypothetical protein